jgi:hypothetical protein
MKKLHLNRLKKLAAHLRRGKLGHKKFDFARYNSNLDRTTHRNLCGTNGCAIGECPIVFPRQWKFSCSGPVLRGGQPLADIFGISPKLSTLEFFKLNEAEQNHLFNPNGQIPESYGGKMLGAEATRNQVARNIEIFIARKEAGKI